MSRDSLYHEYSNLKVVVKGISPKLAIYAELKKRLDELERLIDGEEEEFNK
jgi:hypothetical protein